MRGFEGLSEHVERKNVVMHTAILQVEQAAGAEFIRAACGQIHGEVMEGQNFV